MSDTQREEILHLLYEENIQNIQQPVPLATLNRKVENMERDELVDLLVDLKEDALVENKWKSENQIKSLYITSRGVEKLKYEGYETFLDGQTRYDILGRLYEVSENHSEDSEVFLTFEFLKEDLGIEDHAFEINIWYLERKGLIRKDGDTHVRITDWGTIRFDGYQNEGVEIPSQH